MKRNLPPPSQLASLLLLHLLLLLAWLVVVGSRTEGALAGTGGGPVKLYIIRETFSNIYVGFLFAESTNSCGIVSGIGHIPFTSILGLSF